MVKKVLVKQTKYKNKIQWNKFMPIIIGMVLGAAFSYVLILSDDRNNNNNLDTICILTAIDIMLFVVSYVLQIILHEAGHLIFGLLTGYKFVSFRIGKLTFVNENNKIRIKKYNVVGTAGQCLMMPTEGKGYDCPYILYNLGGIFANAVIASLCFITCSIFPLPKMMWSFLFLIGICGLFHIIMNGIPMKVGGIANDGYNAISIGKYKIARYSFYIMLRVNGLIYKGIRIKDMPLEWFQLPEDADLSNALVCSLKCCEGNYYHDKKEFHRAKKCYEEFLNEPKGLSVLCQNEIKCELLFYEIISECRQDIINRLYTKKLQKYIKATSTYITRKRLMYAYALIVEENKDKAKNILAEAKKASKTYPAKAEVESELEIIEFVKQKFDKCK